MSYTEINAKHVVGRKDYRCEWCNTAIPKGEKHFSRTYVFVGDFNSGRMHLDCEKAMYKSDGAVLEDGWMPGDFKRGEAV